MPKALGAQSYIAWGQQTAFGTAQITLTTGAFIRTGSIFSTRQTSQPRVTTAAIMPKSAQVWQTMSLTDFDATFEYVANDTALLPLLLAAWGRRFKVGAVAPFFHHYTLWNPPVDGGTDGTPAATFYNHSLTIREIPHSGVAGMSPTVVQDICINRFVMTMEANAQLRFQITGTGQKYAASSAPSFTDISGTTLAWQHAIAGANSGLYVGTANPPTTALLAKRVTFELDNNMRYEPFLGAAAGQELTLPTRNGWPSARLTFEMDFEDTAGTDAVQIMADLFAATKENLRIEYYVDANNGLELLATGATAPGIIDDPKPVYSGEGVVGFTFNLNLYPNVTGDPTATNDNLRLVQATTT